ncbi:hypothetical protein AALP_AA8G128800 [Arabis alpina]|uniref:Morc S5 domain-containing protein n=1 Tax=Arabis alpina TaxID=50452 RepID=A0A087G6P3_ARAAL|nr:hypothetical protein AALP_AA8G128800 [Arabis alpina]
MDSSQIAPTKSPILIGKGTNDCTSTNPKPPGPPPGFPDSTTTVNQALKREHVEDDDNKYLCIKKSRTDNNSNIVPLIAKPLAIVEPVTPKLSRQFWKAGDDEDDVPIPHYCSNDAAVRVHPQFLHANATSHKWALGALAELLDNSLDEACNGATYVHVDSKTNQRDENSNILIVEDNGGGMNPNRFRECLSLGYSRKRNMANTVGQYGNGFKTSTMRLGADAIVFSRCRGTNGNNPTQSIGMLSYTFLYETRKCEAIVPTVDFELVDNNWKEIIYSSTDDWFDNLETIVKWSPYLSQQDLFDQFDFLGDQGTRIVIYNLWEDDEGKLELDFDTDPHDIQLRGVNRDEKNIDMAKTYPNSRHFLTYRHSLRSYASILYLRLPPNFRIILRGKDVEHHNLLNDMMMTEDITYRPKCSGEWSGDQNMVAAIKLGFVKDAYHHIDIQGFNVYHKNRLIKPFWRVWNAAGSDGRGVIGILEANFIQPAHNKQGFERTVGLAKLETRLITHQKNYWSSKCQEIGYAPRRKQKNHESFVTEPTRQRDQRSEVPFNNMNHNKGGPSSSSTATPIQCRQNVESSERNRNPQGVVQESGVNMKPDIGIKNGKPGLGISIKETGSVNQANPAAEFQVKELATRIQVLEKVHKTAATYFQEERNRRDVTENNLRTKLREAYNEIDELKKKVNSLQADKTYCKKMHGTK